MARKPSKKRHWSCRKGCKPSNVPCPHLESLLPKEVVEPITYSSKIELVQQHQSQVYSDLIYTFDDESKEKFIANLKKYGMKPFQIELIMDRFAHELTFHEILKKNHWTSMGTLFRTFTKCLNLLKERGFSPQKKTNS